MTRKLYVCNRGRFVRAPKGYYRLAPVLIVGTVLLGVNVTVSAGFAVIRTGVTL
jgi:hypothetical protein